MRTAAKCGNKPIKVNKSLKKVHSIMVSDTYNNEFIYCKSPYDFCVQWHVKQMCFIKTLNQLLSFFS